jgi:hypothetical protein
MTRLNEKQELLFMLCRVLGPLAALKDTDEIDERKRIVARFMHDCKELREKFFSFCHTDKNHNWAFFYPEFEKELSAVGQAAAIAPYDGCIVLEILPRSHANLVRLVESIPIVPDYPIFEAETPFSCYGFLRNWCLLSSVRIDIFDRYPNHTIFHRYLYEAAANAVVTIVTLPSNEQHNKKDQDRYGQFLDVSRLYALERGPNKYRLVTLPGSDFHDRWLRCDDQIFALGGSLKDLDQRFTISRVDPTQDNMRKVDGAMASGIEVFGPSHTSHP